jgi:hypothetical protein
VRTIKTWWWILTFVAGLAFAMISEDLLLRWRNNRLELALSERVHFIEKKPLELLHNAAAVPFNFNVTVWSGNKNHILARNYDQFVISYDIWDETYAILKTQSPRMEKKHLTRAAAEAWCIERMTMDLPGVNPNEPLWVRLEIRAEDGKDGSLFGRGARGSVNESGISLSGLIDLFSRPPQQQSHWGPYDTGPVTLEEINRSIRRGS